MKYDKILLNNKGKAEVCPICENENTDIEGDYCQICGTQISNKCTSCDSKLTGEERYCSICGSASTFLRDNLLKDWKLIKNELHYEETSLEADYENACAQDFKPNYYLFKDE